MHTPFECLLKAAEAERLAARSTPTVAKRYLKIAEAWRAEALALNRAPHMPLRWLSHDEPLELR